MIFSICRICCCFFAPSGSRLSNSCISTKYCPILTNHINKKKKNKYPYDWFCGPGSQYYCKTLLGNIHCPGLTQLYKLYKAILYNLACDEIWNQCAFPKMKWNVKWVWTSCVNGFKSQDLYIISFMRSFAVSPRRHAGYWLYGKSALYPERLPESILLWDDTTVDLSCFMLMAS